jgi:hypothetical protein
LLKIAKKKKVGSCITFRIHFIFAIAFVGEKIFFYGILLTVFHGLIDIAKLKLQNTKKTNVLGFADHHASNRYNSCKFMVY